MRNSILFLFILPVITLIQPALAMVEKNYTSSEPAALTPWYGAIDPAARATDQAYVTGMRPHHLGALSMSKEYLDDPQAQNLTLRQLARGIIRNQTFEIGVLDDIERQLNRKPVHFLGKTWQSLGMEGYVQQQRFIHSPIPNHLGNLGTVTKRDVQFAKAMIVHHQAAVDMAREYHANPSARNGYLDLLNVDIALDQTQEIALMNKIIDAYPGNPDEVKIDPSMIHGMEGMKHGSSNHGEGHHHNMH